MEHNCTKPEKEGGSKSYIYIYRMEAYLSKERQQHERSWENMKRILYAGQIPAANSFVCPTRIPIVAANQTAYLHSCPFKIQFVKQQDVFLWHSKLSI
jgi:hypothetical protein